MSEAALKIVEVMDVDRKAMTYAETVKALPAIKTADEYAFLGTIWKEGKALLKEIDDGYDDLIKAAHKLHKDAVAKKAKYYVPVDTGVKIVKKLMSDYDQEQERIRQAEQRRLEEIARKEEEDRRLQEAILAEEAGEKEEAAAILEEPVYVPPVQVAKATPKLEGGPVYRTVKKFRVVNESLIPRQYLSVDMVKIGGVVRALGMAANIPGVEVYEERV